MPPKRMPTRSWAAAASLPDLASNNPPVTNSTGSVALPGGEPNPDNKPKSIRRRSLKSMQDAVAESEKKRAEEEKERLRLEQVKKDEEKKRQDQQLMEIRRQQQLLINLKRVNKAFTKTYEVPITAVKAPQKQVSQLKPELPKSPKILTVNVTRPINTIKPNQDNISTSQGPQTSRPAYQGLNSIQTAARGLQASPTNVNAIRSETAPRFVNPLPYLPSLPSLPKKATGTLATVASRSNTDGFEIIDIKPASKMVSPKPDVHTASIKKESPTKPIPSHELQASKELSQVSQTTNTSQNSNATVVEDASSNTKPELTNENESDEDTIRDLREQVEEALMENENLKYQLEAERRKAESNLQSSVRHGEKVKTLMNDVDALRRGKKRKQEELDSLKAKVETLEADMRKLHELREADRERINEMLQIEERKRFFAKQKDRLSAFEAELEKRERQLAEKEKKAGSTLDGNNGQKVTENEEEEEEEEDEEDEDKDKDEQKNGVCGDPSCENQEAISLNKVRVTENVQQTGSKYGTLSDSQNPSSLSNQFISS